MDNTAAFFNPAGGGAALKKKELNQVASYCACNTKLNKEKLVRAILGRLRESRILGSGKQ